MKQSKFVQRGQSLLAVLALLAAILAACRPTPAASPTASALPSAPPTGAPQRTPSLSAITPGPTEVDNLVTLRLWLPPQFDPAGNNQAARLLKRRLEQFSQRRPGVTVETRIKAVSGPGGLLDTLTTAGSAAPNALPDLVALPRDLLEIATLKGMLHPAERISQTMQDGDWYPYALELSQLQGNVYGLPFAGDALVLATRPSTDIAPPLLWSQVISSTMPLVFAAGNPQALLTMALYRSTSGVVRGDEGRPALDPAALGTVLAFYAQAEAAGVMPEWLTQIQGEDQVLQSYQQAQANQAITWASHFLSAGLEEIEFSSLPTSSGKRYSAATGWVLTLASTATERQELSAELAQYLTESGFQAAWTAAAGYLPPRISALQRWSDPELQQSLHTIAQSAEILPASDLLTALNPLLWEATVDVLKRQNDPTTAAQAAAAGLGAP